MIVHRRSADGVTVIFVSALNQEIVEYDDDGTGPALLRRYVFGVYIDEVLATVEAPGCPVQHAGGDRQNQAVLERYAYDAYGWPVILAADGETVRAASATGNEILFTGRRLDPQTGLQFPEKRSGRLAILHWPCPWMCLCKGCKAQFVGGHGRVIKVEIGSTSI